MAHQEYRNFIIYVCNMLDINKEEVKDNYYVGERYEVDFVYNTGFPFAQIFDKRNKKSYRFTEVRNEGME